VRRKRKVDAANVREVLRLIGQHQRTPEELRDAAIYWSAAMESRMKSADLQAIAELLRDASTERHISSSVRDRARVWAAWVEAIATA
jgi:hypothetical protein